MLAHGMRRLWFVISLVIISFTFLSGKTAHAEQLEEVSVFGPEKFIRNPGDKVKTETRSFNITGHITDTELRIVNGAGMSGFVEDCSQLKSAMRIACEFKNIFAKMVQHVSRVSQVAVKVNGVTYVDDSNFTRKTDSLAVAVPLRDAVNTLSVEIRGDPYCWAKWSESYACAVAWNKCLYLRC